jgi:hypothetical protein
MFILGGQRAYLHYMSTKDPRQKTTMWMLTVTSVLGKRMLVRLIEN